MKTTLLIFSSLVMALSGVTANVVLPPLISDNMLLQSPKAAVWGNASPGERVTVYLGQIEASTIAAQDGRWRVQLNGLQPGIFDIMTVVGTNTLTIHNVAVGDVWVCSGQSNMQFSVVCKSNPIGGVINFEQEVAAANYPGIRMFSVPNGASETPVEDLKGKWEVCTPEVAPRWSAVGYFFGRKLHQDMKIPIGLISSSRGGTSAQAWTPTDVIQADPDFKAAYYDPRQEELKNIVALKEKYINETLPAWQVKADAAQADGKPEPAKPNPPYGPGEGATVSALYNKMIYGATFYTIKGVVWYQGEANTGPVECDRYVRLLPAMITSWRNAWHQPDFPFYIVQLANYMSRNTDPVSTSFWATIREAQRITSAQLPNCGLAVTIDIGEERSVHPANKQEVGRRLALVAEAKTYGKDIIYSGPAFRQAIFEGNIVKILFEAGSAVGLATQNGEPVKGFALAGEDRKFIWAEAKILPSEQAIVLSAAGVNKPVAVRYAWANNPAVNLINSEGLPAVPFRTDDWPQLQPPPKAQITASSVISGSAN